MNQFGNNQNPSQNTQINSIESGPTVEQQGEYKKNKESFNKNYSKKFSFLPSQIRGKLSGKFELNGDINKSIDFFGREYNLSEISIKNLKKEEISEEEKKGVLQELDNFSNISDLNIRIGEYISKLTKESEKTGNDSLLQLCKEAREIQKGNNISEKNRIITDLKTTLLYTGKPHINNGGEYLNIEGDSQERKDGGENKENSIESPEIITGITDSPYHPILRELQRTNTISPEQFGDITKKLEPLSIDEGNEVFLKLINSIDNKELKTHILSSFDKTEEITEENFEQTDFFKHSGDLININNGVGGLELSLAKNYIDFSNTEAGIDSENNMRICMDTTLNSIIGKNSKDFRKENGELIADIRNEINLDNKYILLQNLYKNNLKTDAKHGGRKLKEELARKNENGNNLKENFNEEKKKLVAEYTKLLEDKKENPGDALINEQINEVIAKAKELDKEQKQLSQSEGILSGGKLDKANENIDIA